MDYVKSPCSCKEGYCPHYNRTLTGAFYRHTHMLNDIGENWRRRWLGLPKLLKKDCGCKGKRSGTQTPTINMTGKGIGDALMGLLCTAAFAEPICYKVSADAMPFVELFEGYTELGLHDYFQDGEPAPNTHDLQLNSFYGVEMKDKLVRIDRYMHNVGLTSYKIPALRDAERIRALGDAYAGAVVLCPHSSFTDREWHLMNWAALAGLLADAGYRPVILAASPRGLDGMPCERVIGEQADTVAGILMNAFAVVSLDSGLAHLTGLLGTPCCVLAGQTDVKRIFGPYSSVRAVTPLLRCRGCNWQEPWREDVCGQTCAALNSITPDAVLLEVDSVILPEITCGRSLLEPAKLAVIRKFVLETNELTGDCAEFGTYKGGSAALIAHYSAHGKIVLYDTFAGQPADDDIHKAGDFADTSLEAVQEFLAGEEFIFRVGEFPSTYDKRQYRFVFVDCDTAAGCRAACEMFGPNMTAGGVILFDDYGYWRTPNIQKVLHEVYGPRVCKIGEYMAAVRF